MAFVLKKNQPKRRYDYDQGDIQFSLFFEFPYKEERDYNKLREKLSRGDEESETVSAGNLAMYTIRSSMKDCEGIVDEEGNPIKLTKEDGSIDEAMQLELFEQVTDLPGVLPDLMVLYTGIDVKNSKSGATQQ